MYESETSVPALSKERDTAMKISTERYSNERYRRAYSKEACSHGGMQSRRDVATKSVGRT